MEVDFVIGQEKRLGAIEVMSSRRKDAVPGIAEFSRRFKPRRSILVGGQGIDLAEFLSKPIGYWLE